MEIYLIRHTTPDVAVRICYGQADLDVCTSFSEEANLIKPLLPLQIEKVYSSPLIRCKKLATYLFPGSSIEFRNELMEINCGEWELKNWDDIDQQQLNNWMEDYINIPFPGGENFTEFNKRIMGWFTSTLNDTPATTVHVTHAGVIRCILAFISGLSIETIYDQFRLEYGTVIRIRKTNGSFVYDVLK